MQTFPNSLGFLVSLGLCFFESSTGGMTDFIGVFAAFDDENRK